MMALLVAGLATALCVAAVMSAGASAATRHTKRPPCTKRALTAGLHRGSDRVKHGRIDRHTFGCAGRFAYAGVLLKRFEITVVFRARGKHWATVQRMKYCKHHAIPKRIFTPACRTN